MYARMYIMHHSFTPPYIHTYIHTYPSSKPLSYNTKHGHHQTKPTGWCVKAIVIIIMIIIVLEVFLFSMNRHLESVFDRL